MPDYVIDFNEKMRRQEWENAAKNGLVSRVDGPFLPDWSEEDSRPDITEQDRQNRQLRNDDRRLRKRGFPVQPCYYN